MINPLLFVAGWMTGLATGVGLMRPPRDRDPDWRRSFNHENTNAPQGPPPLQFIRMDEGRIQRGNGSGGTTTPKPNIVPKPQPPGGRVTDVYGRTIGYQPRPQGSTPRG